MKVIDLINKIANCEKVPKNIKYDGYCYSWCSACDIYEATDEEGRRFNLYDYIARERSLNDEVEIIEEDKKIEKLTFENTFKGNSDMEVQEILVNKINELIEEIEKLKESK